MYLVATWARLGTIELTVTMTASELGRADEHRCSTYSELLVGLGGDFIGASLMALESCALAPACNASRLPATRERRMKAVLMGASCLLHAIGSGRFNEEAKMGGLRFEEAAQARGIVLGHRRPHGRQ